MGTPGGLPMFFFSYLDRRCGGWTRVLTFLHSLLLRRLYSVSYFITHYSVPAPLPKKYASSNHIFTYSLKTPAKIINWNKLWYPLNNNYSKITKTSPTSGTSAKAKEEENLKTDKSSNNNLKSFFKINKSMFPWLLNAKEVVQKK